MDKPLTSPNTDIFCLERNTFKKHISFTLLLFHLSLTKAVQQYTFKGKDLFHLCNGCNLGMAFNEKKLNDQKPGKIYCSTFRGHHDSIIKRLLKKHQIKERYKIIFFSVKPRSRAVKKE